jgi:glycine cleavage system H protein
MANVPTDLKYTKSHEWVRVDGDTATIGITDHAQSELGDIVYIDLPSVGRSLSVDEGFGSVESVKTVSDLYAPVSGEVIEVNGLLAGQSELANSDPYQDGWMIKVRLNNAADADALMSPSEYEASL